MLNYYRYRIPFRKPFKTATKTYEFREGIILTFSEKEILAFGEVAPLPGFSHDSLDKVEIVLKHNHKFLENAFINKEADQIISVLHSIHEFPSLSFGLDTLYHDLNAKRQDLSFSRHLFQKQLSEVESNFTSGIGSKNEVLDHISSKVKEGYSTVKLKVGQNFEKENKLISNIRRSYPDLKIRIDANQSWEQQEAIDNLNELSSLEIEYCEQPVKFDALSSLKAVKENSPVKIAADESAWNISSVRELISNQCCDVVIIKPAIIGRFKDLFVTKELANTHKIEVVYTTLLESKVGRTATAVLAAGLGSEVYAHGLATGSLLKENEKPDRISEGRHIISNKTGLGISIDLTPFEEISV